MTLHQPLATGPSLTMQLAPHVCLKVLVTDERQPCALALTLASGSHDEPEQWLGMAHFLEHLVFRGSRNFAAGDGLMEWVQQAGGRVNARTEARQTGFHFEVDSARFVPALARLADMLAYPLLCAQTLLSEREVLEQEYRMYARTPRALLAASAGPLLQPGHPAGKFHAGNRSTLPVEQAGFLPGLQDFHQRAYLHSPLCIAVSVPGRWADWQTDVLSGLQPLLTQRWPRQESLPSLAFKPGARARMQVDAAGHGLLLHVAMAEQAAGLPLLVEWLEQILDQQGDDYLLTHLQRHFSCSGVEAGLPYVYGGQGVVTLSWKGCREPDWPLLLEMWLDWLGQWRHYLGSQQARDYLERARQHRWLMASPLERVQQVLQETDGAAALDSLDALIGQLQAGRFARVAWGEEAVSDRFDQGLPLAIEELTPALMQVQATACRRFAVTPQPQQVLEAAINAGNAGRAMSTLLPPHWPEGQALCYLGWQVGAAQAALPLVQQRLAGWARAWRWHGIGWQLQAAGDMLFLRAHGPADCLALALNQCSGLLEEPLPEQTRAVQVESPFALRQLMQQLPLWLEAEPAAGWQRRLNRCPQQGLWLGSPVAMAALRLNPPVAGAKPACLSVRPLAAGWHHVREGIAPVDEALLVVLVPAADGPQGLLYQQLAALLQGPLQQRLRSQDGLCYAIFAMPWQQGAVSGLLLATQSSSVSAGELLRALRLAMQESMASLPAQQLQEAVAAFRHEAEQGRLTPEEWSQWCFAAWQRSGYQAVPATTDTVLPVTDAAGVTRALQQVLDDRHWVVLSNQPASGA